RSWPSSQRPFSLPSLARFCCGTRGRQRHLPRGRNLAIARLAAFGNSPAERAPAGLFRSAEKSRVDQVAQAVDYQQVHFLDSRGAAGGNADLYILLLQESGHPPAVAAGEG